MCCGPRHPQSHIPRDTLNESLMAQDKDRKIDNWKAVDIWSLGVLFYQLLSASQTPPFSGNTNVDFLCSVLALEDIRPSSQEIVSHQYLRQVGVGLLLFSFYLRLYLRPRSPVAVSLFCVLVVLTEIAGGAEVAQLSGAEAVSLCTAAGRASGSSEPRTQ